MELLLIRHGKKKEINAYNPQNQRFDPPLTSLGISQAIKTGEFLQSIKINRIISSDMVRTTQTANIINRYTKTPIEFRQELREICFGKLEIEGWSEFENISPLIYKKYLQKNEDFFYPDGESGQSSANRVSPLLKSLKSDKESQKIAFITHGGLIRVILCLILEIDYGKRFQFGYPIHNCSITSLKLNYKCGYFCLQSFNSISHLPNNLISA